MLRVVATALGDLLLIVGVVAVGYFFIIGTAAAIMKLVDTIKRTKKPSPTSVSTTVSRSVPPPDPRAVALNEAAKSSLRLNLMAQNAYESMAQKSRNSPPL